MRSTFGRSLKLAAPFAQRMALGALLGFATIGSSIGLMTTSAYLISRAALQPSIADLQVAIVGVRFFGIARGIFRYLERYVSHDVTFRLLARLRVWFYGTLEPLAPARLMQYRSGDLLARIVADIETLEQFYLRVIAPPVVAVLVALLAAFIVGSFDLRLVAALLLFLLLAGAGVTLLTRSLSRPAGQHMVQVRSELNSSLVDGIQGMADLLAFGQEELYLEQTRNLSGESGGLQQRMTRVEGLHSALTGLLMNLAVLAVLVIAIPLVSSAELDGVYLALLVLAIMSSFEAVWPLPHAAQYLDNSLQAARRLFEIVDAEPAVTDLPSPRPTPTTYGLQVQNLRFSYNRGAPPALDGVSFELPQGRCVAIVGPSGSGKTTLVHLLSRFWEYQEGHIVLAGRELREYGQEDVRQLITVLSQRPHLFNGTVRENLLLARPEASRAEMIQAAQQAQIHEFVTSLPERYDTWIGEQGLLLSGGERQRLVIARSILKDAPILILDEPTANLDALTERDLLATLQGVMADRTTLLITHHLTGLEAANEILVLRAGQIVEQGRHDDLVQMGGLYQRMWELQHQTL
jgi:ATP-binding cassette subfamily C protein CydC